MKVQDIMTRDVQTCTTNTTLPQVVKLMREATCGIIPVIDAHGRIAGVVTDRDISMALIETARKPINIAVHEVMRAPVHGCAPDDDLRVALTTMASAPLGADTVEPVAAASGRGASCSSAWAAVARIRERRGR